MQEAIIISIRIPKEVKTRMRELGIKPSEAAREGIEMEIRRKELLKLQKKATSYTGKWVTIPDRQIAKDVREDRESR
jgi:post-segregation antitoxin (ccd killing protein)